MDTPNSKEYVSVEKFNPEGFHVVADSNTEELNEMGVKPKLVLYYNPDDTMFVITQKVGWYGEEIELWHWNWAEYGGGYEYTLERALEKLRGLSEHID